MTPDSYHPKECEGRRNNVQQQLNLIRERYTQGIYDDLGIRDSDETCAEIIDILEGSLAELEEHSTCYA